MRPGMLVLVVITLAGVQVALAEVASRPEDEPMTREKMEKILRVIGTEARGVPGLLEFKVKEVVLVCISDPGHDRMRIIAQIRPLSDLTSEQLEAILEANFHSALDARYATSQGILYAAFIHPLSNLTERELRSAAFQVPSPAFTFGPPYSSGTLLCGGVRARSPCRRGRTRLRLQPGKSGLTLQEDPPLRYPYAGQTNPGSFGLFPARPGVDRFCVEPGTCYHIPADGYLYEMDARAMHTGINTDKQERIHLVVCKA